MSFAPPFLQEIVNYLATNTGGHFVFADGTGNLKIGELTRGVNGVFCMDSASPPPDDYLPTEVRYIDFWSVNPVSNLAYQDLQYVYDLFHQAYDITVSSWYVYAALALGQIEDMDRDGQGRKMYKLSIEFTIRNLIS